MFRFGSKTKIAKLAADLSSSDSAKARRAASELDNLLYPNYGAGPGLVSAEESQRIQEAHYAKIHRPEFSEPILKALQNGNAFAREYAATVLPNVCGNEAGPILMKVLADPESAVRKAAVRNLGFLQCAAAVPLLLDALYDPDPEMGISAATALGHIRSSAASRPLIALFDRGNCQFKAAVLHALGNILDNESLPFVRAAQSHKLREVQKAARSALAAYDFKRRQELSDKGSSSTDGRT